MPIYSYRCKPCQEFGEVFLSVSDLGKQDIPCPQCSAAMEQYISSPPTIAGTASAKTPGAPINIYDQHADGTVTVNRIGATSKDD